ncbi:HNH endonuclease [Agromyces salentinus]|uniref:HNH nuclease domain-containing protein n=1 Tax=Agromyces salentinus TaxID=269421 RepID=A0ABN2MF91_9MICO|nr:HNH endonuclease signature motif containing protein [Agromyces salentinus]
MVDIVTFDAADVERYAGILTGAVAAVAGGDLVSAAAALQPIAGEVWMGRLTAAGKVGNREAVAGVRPRNESLRAQVFIRDGFRCTYCGGRAVPRCILVAVHDLFPDAVGYDVHYKRGKIHPVFWALAPEADHVVAHSRGGPNVLGNLTTLHAACNTRKSDLLIDDMPPVGFARAGDDWDGLTSFYPALVAAGAGVTRPAYHREWVRRYARLMT